MSRRRSQDMSDQELESLWRAKRDERRSMGRARLESNFPGLCKEIDNLVGQLKLNDYVAFLLKAAIATDDQRIACAAVALAEHGLAGRRTPEHLQKEYSSRHPDGETGMILNVVEQLGGDGESWRAAGLAAAFLGVDGTSFNSARHAIWALSKKGANAKPYSPEAMPAGRYLVEGKPVSDCAMIGSHVLPGYSLTPAVEHLARVNDDAANSRSLSGKAGLSSKNTPTRKGGK
jgi:hypothetical protein